MLVYKYLDINGVKETINNKSVLLKSPSKYKDFFDSTFFIDEGESKKAFDLYINYLLFEGLRSGEIKANTYLTKRLKKNTMIIEPLIRKSCTYNKQLDLAIAYILTLKLLKKKDAEVRRTFKETMQSTLNKIKESTLVSCFGSRPDSSYLWSEYAEGHQGVCMEYEVEGDEYRKVDYKKELPVFQLTRALEIYFGHQICNKEIDTNDKSFWFALDPIFTKLDKYKNEEEIRCVFSNNKRHKDIYESGEHILLKMSLPKRIFIGCKTSAELEKDLRNAYPDVCFEKMKITNIKKGELSSFKD